MSTPISFTVRPPTSAPNRPSPLGNGGASHRGAPSRRLFEQNGEEEDDDDDDGYHRRERATRPKEERIEGFGNGRAIGGDKPAAPLVIPSIPNRDWRATSSRKAPSYKPESKQQDEPVDVRDREGDEPQRKGLRHVVKTEEGVESGVAVKAERVEEDVQNGVHVKTEVDIDMSVKAEPLTLEEQALQALLQGDAPRETEEERLRRELIIDMKADADRATPATEDDAFKRDLTAMPTESTIDDYAAIPVSAFGEAMARGMGWNPGASTGTKIHEPKMRPALLGLGATALQAPVPPSRAGSAAGKKKGPHKREGMKYVMAGAMVKREREGSASASTATGASGTATPRDSRRGSPVSDGKRRRDDDSGRESKRRDRDDGRDRERERDGDRERDRYREREYETEEERARRKAKERERRDRYDDQDRARGGGERDRSGRDRRDDRDRRDRGDRGDRDRDRDRRDRDERGGGHYSDRDRDRERRR